MIDGQKTSLAHWRRPGVRGLDPFTSFLLTCAIEACHVHPKDTEQTDSNSGNHNKLFALRIIGNFPSDDDTHYRY